MSLENPFSKKPVLPPEETNPASNIELIGALLGADSAEAYQKTIAGETAKPQKEKPEFNLNAFDEKAFDKHNSEISTTYTHPDGTKEIITLNLEQKIKEFLSFYQKTKLNLPSDFTDTIRDLWEKHQTAIEEAIEQNGFNDILLIPGNIPLPELVEKMKMEEGYYKERNFTKGGSFVGAVSKNTNKSRIILVHKTQNLEDRPELKQTLNTKGQDVKRDQSLTLEDFLVFQRKYFEETNKHLDEDDWTWLATTSGARLVISHWDPGYHRLGVDALDLKHPHSHLGIRPSRCFF